MAYEIIDNFLELEYFKSIQDKMTSNFFPWYYIDSVGHTDDNKYGHFTHMAYDKYTINSEFYQSLTKVIEKLNPKAIIRIKANLTMNMGVLSQSSMHVDWDFEHKGALLYINTTNGPTILKDGTKIECIANRLLKFNSYEEHASTFCTDQKYRMVINFNYF